MKIHLTCFVREGNTGLDAKEMAEMFSRQSIGTNSWQRNYQIIYKPDLLQYWHLYSASVDDLATGSYFLADNGTRLYPSKMQKPQVDHLYRESPAQSASNYAVRAKELGLNCKP